MTKTDDNGQRIQVFDLEVNPEPWTVPPMSAARGKGGKGLYVRAGVDLAGKNYKDAIVEEINRYEHYMMVPPYEIEFWFWRNLSKNKNHVDATNMQKLTEDALQGLLIDNDKFVRDVHSHDMGQGPDITGRVIIAVTELGRPPRFNDQWLVENLAPLATPRPPETVRTHDTPDPNQWPPLPQTGSF